MSSGGPAWSPSRIKRVIQAHETNSGVLHVATDDGEGFLKGLHDGAGPQGLIAELVGTLLAREVGLRTFEFSLFTVGPDCNLHTHDGHPIHPGPAFLTRLELGEQWNGWGEILHSPFDLGYQIHEHL